MKRITPQIDATIDRTLDASDERTTVRHRSARNVELVEGSGPHLSEETHCLLQYRLKAAAIVLSLAEGLFLIRRIFVEFPALELHVTVFAVVTSCAVVLTARHCLSMAKLRFLELVMFGTSAILLMAVQHGMGVQQIAQGSPRLALVAVKNGTLYAYALLSIYGMFIPNTWRRAAVVVTLVALAPCAVAVALLWQYPSITASATRAVVVDHLSESMLMLFIGSVCAVYGTHTVNRLRGEAFDAKRFGQYRLKQLLGTGGMGEVYLAEHELLKRPCAIKLIRPDLDRNLSDPLVELIRERLPVAIRVVRRSAEDLACTAHLVEEIPHRQPLANVVSRVQLAAWIQRFGSLVHDFRRERNIRRDDEIRRGHEFDNFPVGDVHASRDEERLNPGRIGCPKSLIGNQRYWNLPPPRSAEQDFFDLGGTGIRINPNLHGGSLLA